MTGPRSSAHRARALRPRFLALLPPRSAFRLSSDDTTRTGRVQHDIRGMTSLQNIIAKQPSFAHLMLSTKQVPQRRPAVVQNLCSAAPTVDANCIVGERCKRASRPLGYMLPPSARNRKGRGSQCWAQNPPPPGGTGLCEDEVRSRCLRERTGSHRTTARGTGSSAIVCLLAP